MTVVRTVLLAGLVLSSAVASPQSVEESLAEVAMTKDTADVQSLLARGVEVDGRGAGGKTALSWAAIRGDLEMTEALLEAGADVNLADDDGNTPLILAASAGPELVRKLIGAGSEVNRANRQGETALTLAARRDVASVRVLLDAGANVSAQDARGLDALTVAKASGKDEMVALLRGAGATETPEELLNEAVRRNEPGRVAELIRSGADVNALDTDAYQTPLMTAIQHDYEEIVVLLLAAGADPSIEGTGILTVGKNAFDVAMEYERSASLGPLLEAGGRPEDVERFVFERCDRVELVRWALGTGMNVDARGPDGQTPLICAAIAGAADVVTLLLASGADLTATTDNGWSARAWALEHDHDDVAGLIREAILGRDR